jgi:hypothetical protein
MKSNALTTFERRLERIRSLIRCADVYCLHALAQLRDEQPDLSLIEKIIREGVHSALNWSTGLFMTREEEKVFIEEGPLKGHLEKSQLPAIPIQDSGQTHATAVGLI